MNILLLNPEFPDTYWSFKHALDFIKRKSSNPPLGLITVASLLPQDWNLRLVDLNVNTLRQADLQWADYAFIGAMDIQRDAARQLILRCKSAGLKIVCGGPLFTGEYTDFPEVDHFILNEAELTLPPFLNDLAKGTPQRVYATDDYADITLTPVPRYDLLELKKYDSMSIQFSRGCPFNCDFCNVTALLGHRPRTKTARQVIAELDALYSLGWRRNIFMVDDNFIGNKRDLKAEVLPAIITWRKGKTGYSFTTEASINLADDPELIRLMVTAGFRAIFIGIETPSEESLAECNKTQNRNRDLLAAVKRLHNAGMAVYGGFIVGFDSDTPDIFERQINFIQKSGILCAMVGILQAPYGTRLYERMKKEGRLVNEMTGDNADGTTNIIPHMDARALHQGYRHILSSIYSPRLYYQRVRTFLRQYKPVTAPVKVELQEALALFRSIGRLGILGKERVEYWKLFFWTLLNCPSKFPLAITMSIYGYHFRVVSEKTLKLSPAFKEKTRKKEVLLEKLAA